MGTTGNLLAQLETDRKETDPKAPHHPTRGEGEHGDNGWSTGPADRTAAPGGMAQAVAGACTSYNGGANTGATRWMGKEDPNVVDKLLQVAQMQAR